MAISDKDIQIRITLNSEGVVTGFKQLGEQASKFKEEVEKTDQGLSTFQKTIITANQGLELLGKAFNGFSKTAATAFEFLQRGAAVNDVTESFDQLAAKAGTLSSVFLNQLNEASLGTVRNFDLMQKANENLRAGIKPDEFVKLTQAAKALSQQTGTELIPNLDQLSNAFATGKAETLKNAIGIIDVKKAQEDLARQIGVTTEELSKEQRVYASRKAILAAATKFTNEQSKATVGAGEAIDQLTKAYSDALDDIARFLTANQKVVNALKDIVVVTKEVVKTIIDVVREGITRLENIGTRFADLQSKAPANFFTKLLGFDPAILRQAIDSEFSQIKSSAVDLKEVVTIFSNIGSAWKSIYDEARKGAPTIDNQADVFNKSEEALRKYAEQVERLNSPAGIEELYNQIDRLIGIYRNKLIKINELNDAINKQEKAFTKAGGSVEVFGETVDKALGNNLSDIDGKLSETASQNVGTFESILGAVFGFQPGTTIGAQIATGAGFVANLVEKSVTTGLTKRDTGALIGAAVGAIIGGYIAAAVSFGAGTAVGAALGASVGSSIGSLIGALFTDGTPGTKKIIDKYFADIFNKDRLTVVIGDQLKVIDDLVFGKFINGFVNTANGETTVTEPFKEALAGLPEEIRASFVGVGTALSELINDTGEFGEKLAAVFLGNLENLNNLGILLRQVGASAEDLQDALLETFLSGDISAVELVTGLQGIQTALAEGIPDGIGLVEEAFNNLFAAGSKGGAALVDAIRDVAIEAKERGVNSLDALRQELLKTFDAATVDAFFQALAQNGIDSIEELGEASDITAANIAAALESAGLLADQSIKKAEEIAAKLEELETRAYETSLTIKVRTEFEDGNAQQALGQTGQSLPGIAS